MRPSRRVQALAVLFVLVIAGSLTLAPAPAPLWRGLAGLCAACLLWQPMQAVIFQSGPRAVRRLRWAANGTWSIVLGDGIERGVSLHPTSAALGPWLMLVWTSPPERFARRWYGVIDAASVSPVTFQALRGRLKLDRTASRERGRPSAPGPN